LLIAEERGIAVTTSQRRSAAEDLPTLRASVVTVSGGHAVAADLFGPRNEGRITEIDGFRIEVIPAGHMLVLHNRDVPGVIGKVGTCLGARQINISRFHLGRRERGGEAMAVIETDGPVSDETLNALRAIDEVISVRYIELDA
jgi:D-3-phosphoglycerate dehydrogenase